MWQTILMIDIISNVKCNRLLSGRRIEYANTRIYSMVVRYLFDHNSIRIECWNVHVENAIFKMAWKLLSNFLTNNAMSSFIRLPDMQMACNYYQLASRLIVWWPLMSYPHDNFHFHSHRNGPDRPNAIFIRTKLKNQVNRGSNGIRRDDMHLIATQK